MVLRRPSRSALFVFSLLHFWDWTANLQASAAPATNRTSRVQFSIPQYPESGWDVAPNFLGISFELSFMNVYFGDDMHNIPPATINYLAQLRERTGSLPVRARIGGNSGDISKYVPSQKTSIVLTDPTARVHNQPATYGPALWDTMREVAELSGGTNYIIGLSLNDPEKDNPSIAAAAKKALGSSLDAILLGNEPDLYTGHGHRPQYENYTTYDYFGEFGEAYETLKDTPAGNLVTEPIVGGPTLCCGWDVDELIVNGYLERFGSILKYFTVQHYPQNNCFDEKPTKHQVDYYNRHANVVELTRWQKPGFDMLLSDATPTKAELVMSEFNTVSCGGIPGISDTFGAGSLWTVDYALQMASAGYGAAYIHTREPGISYNLMEPVTSENEKDDSGSDSASESKTDSATGWNTLPPYYAVLATAEILQSEATVKVVDLNISNSTSNTSATVAGYGIYDTADSSLTRIVLFNFAENGEVVKFGFNLPDNTRRGPAHQVKYLSSNHVSAKWDIAWGGKTFNDVKNGLAVDAPLEDWARRDTSLDCSSNCTLDVPGPAMAVVFLNPPLITAISVNRPTSGGVASTPLWGAIVAGVLGVVGWCLLP